MGNNIDQTLTVQPTTAARNPETTVEPTIAETEFTGSATGSENGGIYFELDWETGQAQQRRSQLLTTYSGGDDAGAGGDYSPVFDAGGTIIVPDYADYEGFGGNSFSPRSHGYNGNHYGDDQNPYGNAANENNPFDLGDNSTFPFYSPIRSDENASLFSTDEPRPVSWDDFVNLLDRHPDFSDFRNESPEFWREVRRFSETPFLQNDGDGFEPKNVSKYKNLLNEMNSKQLSLDEFVETLPPREKEVFKARFQIDRTFGENIFAADGVTLNETGQLRAREAAIENGQLSKSPENTAFGVEKNPEFAVRADREFEFPKNPVFVNENGAPVSPNPENGEFIAASLDAESVTTFGENLPSNQIVPEKIETGEVYASDKSAQVAVGNNVNFVSTDNGAARGAGGISTDHSTSVGAISRRDGGTVLGGALISGSFASIENFQNAESERIGNSNSVKGADFGGANSFAAGATGAMMSAAIGSIVPGSETVVSGVVGFVSGVVIGVEADQGLRWLSGDRPTANAAPVNYNLLEENSFA